MLKEAAKSKKKKSSNKGDEDDSEGEEMAMMRQQMLEEQAKNTIEEEEVDEEEMRVHEGLNTIAHSWAKPLTLRQEGVDSRNTWKLKNLASIHAFVHNPIQALILHY